MLILQIALGIVLGYLIIRYWDILIGLSLIALVAILSISAIILTILLVINFPNLINSYPDFFGIITVLVAGGLVIKIINDYDN